MIKSFVAFAVIISLVLPSSYAIAGKTSDIPNFASSLVLSASATQLESDVAMDAISAFTTKLTSYSKMTPDMNTAAAAGNQYLNAVRTADLEFKAFEGDLKSTMQDFTSRKDHGAQEESLTLMSDSLEKANLILEKN